MVMGGCADKAGETYDVEKSKKKQKPQVWIVPTGCSDCLALGLRPQTLTILN